MRSAGSRSDLVRLSIHKFVVDFMPTELPRDCRLAGQSRLIAAVLQGLLYASHMGEIRPEECVDTPKPEGMCRVELAKAAVRGSQSGESPNAPTS